MIKASPLKLHQIDFLRVSVEVNDQADPEKASEFDFNGATIGWAFRQGQHEDGTVWIAVGFATEAEPEEGPICPYVIDMQAVGSFSLHDNYNGDNAEKFVFECGAALVYGAIREMVANITARSALGRLVLPTPSFQGLYEQHEEQEEAT